MENANRLNPGSLAFLGDAVYSLLVREMLAEKNLPLKDLHSRSLRFVSAPAQAAAYEKIKGLLTEAENDIFHRGRNFHTNNIPKSATQAEYHIATGLECLFGYLYLAGEKDRINYLFKIISE